MSKLNKATKGKFCNEVKKNCLIIFAKEPEIGRVKTRLSKYLSKAQCLNIYKAFLKDTIALSGKINCDCKVLAYESNGKSPEYLKKAAKDFLFYRQTGKDLGEKMHNAFKFANKNNMQKTVIIGSDSPDLPSQYIKDAFARLNKKDVVIGPSSDGGYYLIGLNKPCLGLFKNIKWSKADVLEKSIEKSRKLNMKLSVLKTWYDVDEPETLRKLKSTAHNTQRLLNRWS